MEINDFKGLSYFRFFVPTIFVICWVSMILGPKFTTLYYREFCFLVYLYFISKTVYQMVLTITMIIKGNAAL